ADSTQQLLARTPARRAAHIRVRVFQGYSQKIVRYVSLPLPDTATRSTMKIALFGHGRWGKNIKRVLDSFTDVSTTVIGRSDMAPSQVDGVVIATPISTHTQIAMPYIRQGIPVFIEKPLTDSITNTRRMLEAAKKYRTLVHVGHIHLHNAAF